MYSSWRLDQRLFLFEHVFLPSWRAQTDGDFTLVILIGDQLPETARKRLEQLVEDIPQIVIAAKPEAQKLAHVAKEVTLSHRPDSDQHIAEFRLDDDDAVGIDYVERIRTLYSDNQQTVDRQGRFAISFSKGVMLNFRGNSVHAKGVFSKFWTPGLTYVWRANVPTTFSDFKHRRIWSEMTTIVDPTVAMYVRSAHSLNASAPNLSAFSEGEYLGAAYKNIRGTLRNRFNIDLPLTRKGWSQLCIENAQSS